MNVVETRLPGVVVIEPRVFGDHRGFFLETFQLARYRDIAGLDLPFVQDNHSRSNKGVLRGMHAQKNRPQGKLLRVARGAVFDAVVDISPTSDTFGQWVGVTLSDENHRQIWVPPGYAHGFLVLSEIADVEYKCTEYYYPQDEIGLIWNDPEVAIEWPLSEPTLSEKDSKLPSLAAIRHGA